ncbi:PVC-type heme-binding CxxCH protein [Chitinophaga barathri]|uniref:Dehydrogenase n=1 Tax=Chitinophaga barathri TaxID=1647451 RepID=A0A3N4MPX3_9BACT|nr:PVC-type heme-binding CxxCH protein [Chitinophaga barathri]RPD42150.1 dehydrogenase [Chitinophaga barathri]
MNVSLKVWMVCVSLVAFGTACNQKNKKQKDGSEAASQLPESDNEDVARYMQSFSGVGALSDSSEPTLPEKTLAHFKYPDDLALDLVLSEPQVVQPVELSFDHRGRLWVVQYHQYPYPRGLKVTSVDNYLRVKFDKVPAAPPEGAKGADKISIFEDTDGDGKYDKTTDAITGLNIATSVLTGLGKVWVLNPPYLLAYPDADHDGIPEGAPQVCLEGFGLEDTHAVANSLRWGPDGWLYGAQGSTTTANVSSSVSKNVAFQGQAVWRYHPVTQVFEVFAEGGGNTFNVEFDSKGRVFSGDNGYDRGPNFKQGGYYQKSLGKHGPYTNAYTFGHLPSMPLTGEKKRFTHSLIRYEETALPERYKGKMIAVNPLLNFVQLTRFEQSGSSYKNIDEDQVLKTDDHWFRPVNIKAGPDGAVYLADWYDSRLSHVDPRDTWHKSSGRVYRLRNKTGERTVPPFDLGKYTPAQLIALLKDENKWYRQQAQVQFANRGDRSLVPALLPLLRTGDAQTALEALWAINGCKGYNDDVALIALAHKDPYVRYWAVRLAGDNKSASPLVTERLTKLAQAEQHPEVRSQLASTAKRMPGPLAVAMIAGLLKSGNDAADPDIPLLTWWAVEAKAETDRDLVLAMFKNRQVWQNKTVQGTILKRLVQRYVMPGGETNYAAAAQLIEMAPSPAMAKILIGGLSEGLRGKDITGLSPALTKAIQPYQAELFGAPLALAVKQGDAKAIDQAIKIISDGKAEPRHRLAYIRIMGETGREQAVPALLKVVAAGNSSGALKETGLQALQYFSAPEIGTKIVAAYPQLRGDVSVRNAAVDLVSSRASWAASFLDAIEKTKVINRDDVSEQAARKLKLLKDEKINEQVNRLWPNVKLSSTAEKNESITRYLKLIKAGGGNVAKGKVLYQSTCGACHRLFDAGGNIGPDLTGYDRDNMNSMLLNIIDPNADIREGYVIHRIVTTDGRTLEGKIVSRNGNAITLQPMGGKDMILSATQVKEMKAQQTSVMPERLLDRLSDQEIKDIFSYIMKK